MFFWQLWTKSLVNSSLLNSHSLSIGLQDSLFNLLYTFTLKFSPLTFLQVTFNCNFVNGFEISLKLYFFWKVIIAHLQNKANKNINPFFFIAHGATSQILYMLKVREATKEYWMIYRGPSFLAVVWLGSSPTPSPSRQQVGLFLTLPVCRRRPELSGGRRGGEGGGGEAESYDGERDWSSINHSILFRMRQGPIISLLAQEFDVIFFCMSGSN
jgi:hypothetical protein